MKLRAHEAVLALEKCLCGGMPSTHTIHNDEPRLWNRVLLLPLRTAHGA